MLQITIPAGELFDDEKCEFITNPKECKLVLEHSLVSLSKWESKWKKPFLSKEEHTEEETVDYIRCMTITQNVDPIVYNFIDQKTLKEVIDYIEDPMTATWFGDEKKRPEGSGPRRGEVVTAELIYYWMISLNIPWECQKWHLNRLLTLIKVCNIKNTPPEKLSRRELMSRNKALNESRKAALHSKG